MFSVFKLILAVFYSLILMETTAYTETSKSLHAVMRNNHKQYLIIFVHYTLRLQFSTKTNRKQFYIIKQDIKTRLYYLVISENKLSLSIISDLVQPGKEWPPIEEKKIKNSLFFLIHFLAY